MELTGPFFLLVLTALFILHWFGREKWRTPLLLIGSYGLYALWDLKYLYVLVASTLIDFKIGSLIGETKNTARKRALLLASLACNIGILFFFKYVNFISVTASVFMTKLGFPYEPFILKTFIPLGVSFYTFHSISYVADIFRGKITASKSLTEYALYVSFFPKLIAGPIERAEEFLPQLRRQRTISVEDFFQAIKLLSYGFFLKLCIGDRLGAITDGIFNEYASRPRMDLWLGYYGYAMQIYADFFGYTLIARGAAQLFGLRLNENFLNPYWSASPQEFWRRWHTSLSSWFRDYVYIPLGGGKRRVYFNIMATMALAGLWHGAEVKFVVWGLYHGALVCLQRVLLGPNAKLIGWARWLGVLVTFHLVSFGWLFFKSESLAAAAGYAGRMFSAPYANGPSPLLAWMLILFSIWALFRLACIAFDRLPLRGHFNAEPRLTLPFRSGLLGCMFLLIALLGVSGARPFVYFYF